jgi:preprotein translocase subunit YajC
MNQLFIIADAATKQEQGLPWDSFMLIGLMIVIFYFFLIRPQSKKQKEARNFRESLQKGDKIVTAGGVYGKIVEVADRYAIIEIDNNVKIKIDKASIVTTQPQTETKTQ